MDATQTQNDLAAPSDEPSGLGDTGPAEIVPEIAGEIVPEIVPEISPAEIAIAAASLVPLRASSPDITACTVAGVEYAVSQGVAHVEAAHVAQLVDIGFTL